MPYPTLPLLSLAGVGFSSAYHLFSPCCPLHHHPSISCLLAKISTASVGSFASGFLLSVFHCQLSVVRLAAALPPGGLLDPWVPLPPFLDQKAALAVGGARPG